jgi:hypothetical protein
MRKPKRERTRSRGYWDSTTDEALLAVDLTTDDPEKLENLVYEIPSGDEEPYVEFAYDLRGTEREKLRCVFENHRHLSGFVMNKGARRFMVGGYVDRKSTVTTLPDIQKISTQPKVVGTCSGEPEMLRRCSIPSSSGWVTQADASQGTDRQSR